MCLLIGTGSQVSDVAPEPLVVVLIRVVEFFTGSQVSDVAPEPLVVVLIKVVDFPISTDGRKVFHSYHYS